MPGFFGGFTGLWIASGNVCRFRISVEGNSTYSQWSLTGVGVVVKNIYNYTNAESPVAAATSSNQAVIWNGGIPYSFKQLTISVAVSALTSGQTIDFYIYHPFTCGYTQMFRGNSRFTQPIVVQTIEDESIQAGSDGHIVDNQIHIRLLAVGNVSASTQYIDIGYGS